MFCTESGKATLQPSIRFWGKHHHRTDSKFGSWATAQYEVGFKNMQMVVKHMQIITAASEMKAKCRGAPWMDWFRFLQNIFSVQDHFHRLAGKESPALPYKSYMLMRTVYLDELCNTVATICTHFTTSYVFIMSNWVENNWDNSHFTDSSQLCHRK